MIILKLNCDPLILGKWMPFRYCLRHWLHCWRENLRLSLWHHLTPTHLWSVVQLLLLLMLLSHLVSRLNSPVVVLSSPRYQNLSLLFVFILVVWWEVLVQALQELHLLLVLELFILYRCQRIFLNNSCCVWISWWYKRWILSRCLLLWGKKTPILCSFQHFSSLNIFYVVIGGTSEKLGEGLIVLSTNLSTLWVVKMLKPFLTHFLLSSPVWFRLLLGLVNSWNCILSTVNVYSCFDCLKLILIHSLIARFDWNAIGRNIFTALWLHRRFIC